MQQSAFFADTYIAVRIAVVAWFYAWVVRVKRDLERAGGVVAVGVRFERGLYHTAYRLLSGLFRLAWYRLFRLILSGSHASLSTYTSKTGILVNSPFVTLLVTIRRRSIRTIACRK